MMTHSLALAALLTLPSAAHPGKAPDPVRTDGERDVLALLAAGTKDFQRGEVESAGRLFRKAVALCREVYPRDKHPDGHLNLALALNNLSLVLRIQGQRDKARSHLEEALAIFKKALPADHPAVIQGVNNLGVLLHELGNRDEARPLLEQGLALRKKTLPPGHPDLAHSLNNLGELLHDLGQRQEARAYLEQALAIRTRALPPDHPDLGHSYNNLAAVLRESGQAAEARPLLERSLAIFRKALPKDHPTLAASLSNLGDLLNTLGKWEEARGPLEEALAIRTRALPKDHPDVATSLHKLGLLLNNLGKRDEARAHLEQALAIRRRALPPDHPDLAQSLNNLGGHLRLHGRPEEAVRYLNEALRIDLKVLPPNHPQLAQSMNNAGLVLRDLGKRKEARAPLERALAIRRKTLPAEHSDLHASLHNLGVLEHELGNAKAALAYYEEALALRQKTLPPDHPDVVSSRSHLGALLWGLGRRDDAWSLLSEAVGGASLYLRRVATAIAQRDHPDLLRQERHLLDVFLTAATGMPDLSEARREEVLLRLLERKGVSTVALASRRDALLSRADAEARALAAKLSQLRLQLAHLLLQGPNESAPRRHREECAALQRDIDALERDLGLRVQPLALLQRAHTATPGEVAARLPAGAALVEIVRHRPNRFDATPGAAPWGPPRYLAVLLSAKTQVRLVDLGEAAPLEEAVATWRAAVQRGRADADAERTLRERLWAPLAMALPQGTRRLIVAPEGAVALVPLEAIRLEGGEYLVERYTVSYVSGGRDLMPSPAPPEGARDALVLADPDYDLAGGAADKGPGPAAAAGAGLSFRRLPGFAREAAAVAKLLGGQEGWRVEARRGPEAGEEALAKASRPRLLHCITHGFFLEDVTAKRPEKGLRDLDVNGPRLRLPNFGEDPRLRSGLALAGANRWRERSAKGLSDGLLTALEVENLDLWGTELVVLSACDTGRGAIQVGEGVLGLRRAFQLAGAQTVLASLWKVPDAETEQLMTDTLSRWLKGMSPHEALREAQLAMIQRLRAEAPRDATRGLAPPLYWAAFICHGHDR